MKLIVALMFLVLAPAAAQRSDPAPTLVAGSEVNLAAVTGADWIQGEGPTAFEPGKVYIFECWATWCGPCVTLIPHVNELHRKYYDKGLRVHGMDSWEEDKDKAVKFVQAKGEGMSYPVAYVAEGSAFETKWLNAAGVTSIPYAFVVRNGKLLLGTEASRLTDSLIEKMLSGDEGAAEAAAEIKAAFDAREETDELVSQIVSASRDNNTEQMEANLEKLETIDPGHPELPVLKLSLLIASEEWTAAVTAFNEIPKSEYRTFFIYRICRSLSKANEGDYPVEFTETMISSYDELLASREGAFGPNHFARLSMLQWKFGDKPAATATADKGLQVAKNFIGPHGHDKFSEAAFVRFAKSVNEGTMPTFSDLSQWQRDARENDAAKKEAPPAKE